MVSKLKSKLFKSIKSKKLNVFIFFLILSFVFLVIAKLSKTYTETILFHVTYKNVPDQHSITNDRDSIITVRVNAYGFNLLPHNFYRHTLTVNFNKEVQKHGNKYYWETKKAMSRINSQLGSAVEVISVQPDSLTFPYDVMTVKKVPVKLDGDITYASGYDILDSLKLEPDSVKVIGPKNIIDKITRIKTKELKLKDVNSSFSQSVDLVIDKSLENVKLNKKSIAVSGTVEKFTEGIFEVPVDIINLPNDVRINFFPKTILVSYYVSLENYKKIRALDFKVICDYAQVKDHEKSFFSPQLIAKPKEVKSAKMKQNKVEFILIE